MALLFFHLPVLILHTFSHLQYTCRYHTITKLHLYGIVVIIQLICDTTNCNYLSNTAHSIRIITMMCILIYNSVSRVLSKEDEKY